jgi:hypothetical protein
VRGRADARVSFFVQHRAVNLGAAIAGPIRWRGSSPHGEVVCISRSGGAYEGGGDSSGETRPVRQLQYLGVCDLLTFAWTYIIFSGAKRDSKGIGFTLYGQGI